MPPPTSFDEPPSFRHVVYTGSSQTCLNLPRNTDSVPGTKFRKKVIWSPFRNDLGGNLCAKARVLFLLFLLPSTEAALYAAFTKILCFSILTSPERREKSEGTHFGFPFSFLKRKSNSFLLQKVSLASFKFRRQEGPPREDQLRDFTDFVFCVDSFEEQQRQRGNFEIVGDQCRCGCRMDFMAKLGERANTCGKAKKA